ncbi:MAG: hypothetical protein AAB176_09415 [Pseudomonadota bacterium]
MSVLTDPEFSGRHLRKALRQQPDICEAELRLHTTWPIRLRPKLAQEEVVLTEGSPDQLLACIDCFEKPTKRMPLLATR